MHRMLEYPLGCALVPATPVQRTRPIPPGAALRVQVGQSVAPDTVIAEMQEPDGVQPLLAGIAGTVTAADAHSSVTIAGNATIVQGILGLGATTAAPLVFLQRGESLAMAAIPRGAILGYPERLPLLLLQRAVASGAAGIIAGSANTHELEAFLRADLSLLLESSTSGYLRSPLPVLLTEGVGDAPMHPAIHQTLAQHAGSVALLTCATLPAQAIRPELLLSLPGGRAADAPPLPLPDLHVGARVSIIAGARRGATGIVRHLFTAPQLSPSGQLIPSASIQFEDGASEIHPLHCLLASA